MPGCRGSHLPVSDSPAGDVCDLSEEKIRTSIDDAFEFFLGITLKDILDVLDPSSDVRDFALASSSGPESFVTYPICCRRIMEILGLAYLWFREKEMSDKADWSIGKLVELVKKQPGCLHPISNRYATSYPPAVIALSIAGKQDVADYLVRNTVVNVCDTITSTSPFGLASPYADPSEEINRVLGSAFSIFNYNMNPDSLLAAVFSDLCAEYLPELYADVVNDFKAVGAVFSTVFSQDKYNALFKNRGEVYPAINVQYPDDYDSVKELYHISKQETPHTYEQYGSPVLSLLIGCLNRDRPLSDSYFRFE